MTEELLEGIHATTKIHPEKAYYPRKGGFKMKAITPSKTPQSVESHCLRGPLIAQGEQVHSMPPLQRLPH